MRYFSNILKIVLIGFLLWATGLFVYAIFSPPIIGEAYIGSFEVDDLSEGWTMISPDGETMENVILPVAGDVVSKGKTVTFENTLPEDVHSGMRLCVRTAMSDVKVAIIASECDEKTQKLKNCIEAQDWDGYGITAHSIKGLMASIGLKELSERAKKHEYAAGDLDTEFIKTDSGSFIEAYREVCKKLR